MSNFSKWNDKSQEPTMNNEKSLHAVMFVARNKDNNHLEGFTERREVFLTTKKDDMEYLNIRFNEFASRGVTGEVSRFYMSVNSRNKRNTQRALQHYLLDHDDVNLAAVPAMIVRMAMSRDNAETKNRLFDFDLNDESKLEEFITDLKERGLKDDAYYVNKTPNGYAVVIERGVDLRGLVDTMPDAKLKDKKDKGPWKWSKDEVGYKIDDLVLVQWTKKRETN